MNRNISSVSWGYTKIGIFNKVKKRMAVILKIRIHAETGFAQYLHFFHSRKNTGKHAQ